MEALGIALIIGAVVISNIACFYLGAKIGQTVSKGETIKLPDVELNPIKAFKEYKEESEFNREQQKELDKLDAILANLESYDGTGAGQKDIPLG